jgi:hypothetical protein
VLEHARTRVNNFLIGGQEIVPDREGDGETSLRLVAKSLALGDGEQVERF